MTDVQKGTLELPIRIKPRIDGLLRTQTQIKTQFSNTFINDGATPIAFTLEYRKRADAAPLTQAWDPAKSSDDTIYFDMPDTFYALAATFTILVYWTIGAEKIYMEEAIVIHVKDFHRQN